MSESTPPPDPLPAREEGEKAVLEKGDGHHVWLTQGSLYERLKPLARQKRNDPTPSEAQLWQVLRKRQVCGVKFRRQHAIERFIVDFYSGEADIVIEVDAPIHEYTPEEDAIRQEFLEAQGLQVLRFTNDELFHNIDVVIERITYALLHSPSSRAGKGAGGGV